ncbi:MAG: CHAT domain-containing tetratricopeptide repeat protein [Cyanobacteria bacterium J06635_10]
MNFKRITSAAFIALFSTFIDISLELSFSQFKIQATNSQLQAQTSSRKQEAVDLVNQGIEQLQNNQLNAAIKSWELALNIYKELDDSFSQGSVFNYIGSAYRKLNEYQKALDSFEEALAIFRKFKQKASEGTILNNIGLTYTNIGKYQEAIKFYQQALEIKKEYEDRRGQATLLNNIGTAYRNLNQYNKALENYQQALPLYKSVIDKAGEATTLNNIAAVYNNQGKYSQALKVYKQVLEILPSTQISLGTTLNNLGVLYRNMGKYQDALSVYARALKIFREVGNRQLIGTNLTNIGEIFNNIGQYDKALEFYREALAIRREIKDNFGESVTLNSIGAVYRNLNEYQLALKSYRRALNIKQNIGDEAGIATTLNNMGNIQLDRGEYNEALELYEQALTIYKKVGKRPDIGTVLNNIGSALQKQEKYKQAIDYHLSSLAIAREVKDPLGEGAALINLGNAYYKQGNFKNATEELYKAINVLESLRPGLTDAEKISIFETQEQTYRVLQKVLVAQNKFKQALEIAERGRARAFIELLAQRLSSDSQLQATTSSPSISKIQQIAKTQKATLIEYSIISDKELYIWVIKPTGEIAFRQVDLKSLNTSLENFVATTRLSIGVISRGIKPVPKLDSKQTLQPLQKLHQTLIEPIADLLPQNPQERIIFVPHKSLFLIPFPALKDAKGKHLIEKHTILTTPAIQVLDFTHKQRQRISGKGALVVGDPTIKPNISREYRIKQLPSAKEEAIKIANLLKTKPLIGNQPTVATVLKRMPSARIIHLATHGLLDDVKKLGIPGTIVLAPDGKDNGLLTASDILNLKLNAELVVLSACDTGRGRITGDGVIGLSRSLITAGVPSIVVTLWKIPDESSEKLMTQFYQNLQQNPDKAQALRQAMLTTMKQYPKTQNWAAFTLIGETK